MTRHTPPRHGLDSNQFLSSHPLSVPHYSNDDHLTYNYSHQPSYDLASTQCTGYASALMSFQQSSSYSIEPAQMAAQYHYARQNLSYPTSNQRGTQQTLGYFPIQTSQQYHSHPCAISSSNSSYPVDEIESQESVNEDTMLSEPAFPTLDGYPDIKEFDRVIKEYVDGLSPKKQDKALIHAKRARNIRTVLNDKKTTTVESAQFRFWVKKMFTLDPSDLGTSSKKILHEGKPVAVREKLFKILTKAHTECQHGGRDKTSAQVRRIYSWVPKELISRFVKICPTCRIRRGNSNRTPPPSRKSSPLSCLSPPSPEILSPPDSCRSSLMSRQSSIFMTSPVQSIGLGSVYQGGQWTPSGRQLQVATSMHHEHGSVLMPTLNGLNTTGLSVTCLPSSSQNGIHVGGRNFNFGHVTPESISRQHNY